MGGTCIGLAVWALRGGRRRSIRGDRRARRGSVRGDREVLAHAVGDEPAAVVFGPGLDRRSLRGGDVRGDDEKSAVKTADLPRRLRRDLASSGGARRPTQASSPRPTTAPTAPRHDGRRSERIVFESQGAVRFITVTPPKVPVTPDLTIRLYVRANQPGIEPGRAGGLAGRYRSGHGGQPSFVTIPGVRTDASDRWSSCALADLPIAVERQARILRIKTRRPIKVDGVYLDTPRRQRPGGPGPSEVFVDDLTIAPGARVLLSSRPDAPPADGRGDETARTSSTNWTGTASVATAVPGRSRHRRPRRRPRSLAASRVRRPGPPEDSTPNRQEGGLGRLVVDAPTPIDDHGAPRRPAEVVADAAIFPNPCGRVLEPGRRPRDFEADLEPATRARASPSRRPGHSRPGTWLRRARHRRSGRPRFPAIRSSAAASTSSASTPCLGARPWSRTSSAPTSSRASHARGPVEPAGPLLDDDPADAPRGGHAGHLGRRPTAPWGRPRLQPEQVRLFAYAALAAGYRGLAFRGDSSLTGPQGRMLMLELELLNDELRLIGPASRSARTRSG